MIKGYVYIILSAVLFGCMPLMANHIYADGVNAMTLVLLRNAVSLPMLASLGLFLNKSFFGRRVYDILCTINLLHSHGAESITLKAFGNSRYPALFAALLSDKKVKIELAGGLPATYEQAFDDLTSPIPQSCVPYGILKIADIDEIYAQCLKAE